MTWTRSSACDFGNCVEVRHVDGHVEVRDNTAPDDVLHITPADWAAFLVGAKAGEFDGPAVDTGQARLAEDDDLGPRLGCGCLAGPIANGLGRHQCASSGEGTIQAATAAERCSCTATHCLISCVICGRVSYDGDCPNEPPVRALGTDTTPDES
jgi:hypothetical protein